MVCWYSRDWPTKFAILLLVARVTRHVQTTQHLSVLTRLENIYYTGWVIRTGAIREKRLLIKLSFTRVNYPDGTSGKLIAIVEVLFVRAASRLINVTALLRNRRFFSLINIYAFSICIFPDVLPTCFLSTSFRITWKAELQRLPVLSRKLFHLAIREGFYYFAENVYLSFVFW